MDASDPGLVAAAEALVALARAGGPRAGGTRVIAIDGPSGSGKTTLARLIHRLTGCGLVHLDAIYPGWDGLAATPALVRDWLLEPLATGGEAGYRRYDWKRQEYAGRVPVVGRELLVVEGVGSGAAPCRPYLTALAWVEAPLEVRRVRALARDGAAYRPYWQRWGEQEALLYAADPVREHAGLEVRTGSGWSHSLRGYGLED